MCIRVCACASTDDITDEYVYIDSDTTTSKTKGVEKKDEKNREKKHIDCVGLCLLLLFTSL